MAENVNTFKKKLPDSACIPNDIPYPVRPSENLQKTEQTLSFASSKVQLDPKDFYD